MMKLTYCFLFILISVNLFAQEEFVIDDAFKEEIKELYDHPKIQKAFQVILDIDDKTVDNHIILTEVPAPPFKEDKRGVKFKEMIRGFGFDKIWTDEVGNVLALKNGKKGNRTVALDAHLDTVFPEETDVSVKIKGDTLFAPGIGDDTRGLAMVIAIAEALDNAEIELEADLLIVGSVGEEGLGDLRGVKHLFREDGPRIDSWISIDGGNVGRVNNKALGSFRYRVKFVGPGGHSWGAFGLVNPHHALGDAINRFVERADYFTSYGPRTSYNIGVISGGTSVNSIPFESIMEVDMRSEQHSRLDTISDLLLKSVHEAVYAQNTRKRRGQDMTVEIEQIGNRPSGEVATEEPLIQRALAVTAAIGKAPRLTRGSTNSNIPISMGIPSVTIGRGGIALNAHSLDEWWINKEGYKAIQLALLLTVAEAGVSN